MTTVCTKRFFTKTFGIIRLRSYTCRIFIFLKLRISHKRCSKRHFNIFEEIKSLYIAQKQSHHLNDRKKSRCNRANDIIKFVSNYIIKSATFLIPWPWLLCLTKLTKVYLTCSLWSRDIVWTSSLLSELVQSQTQVVDPRITV